MKKYLLLLLVFTYGCAVKPLPGGVVRIRLRENPTTLDPALIVDVAGGAIAAKLFNGLVRVDEACKIIPDIAESWEVSEDGLVYTFKLHKGVKFVNGKILTAYDVKRSFERIIRESPRKWIFEKVSKIHVINDLELQIILKEPYSPFLSMLTMPNAYISPDGKTGTGPYELISWEHDKKIVLKKRDSAHLNIEYHIISEEFTAQAEFDLGNLDIMEVSPIQWLGVSKNKKNKAKQFSQTGLNTYYIGFNCRKPLFKNTRFRQALNYAIDRTAIINSILQGQAVPAWGPIPPALLKCKETYKYNYLPNKARRLLGGKYTMLENPIRLYVRAQAQAIQIAEVVQYYLSKIGAKVIITPLEWSAFKKAIDGGEADIFLMSWWGDYPDPDNFLFPTFHSDNIGAGGNRAYFQNKKIDKIIEKAQKELDLGKRSKLYYDTQRYISRQAPWIFLWHAKELYIIQSWVEGFKLYPIYNGEKGEDIKLQTSKFKQQNKS